MFQLSEYTSNWRTRKGLIVFIPFKNYDPDCGVKIIEHILKSNLSRFKHVFRIDRIENRTFQVFRKNSFKHVILFAHPNENSDGFLVNPDCKSCFLEKDCSFKPNCKLTPDVWREDKSYNMMFAHVCSGAEILNSERWKQKFPHWVSFSGDIKVYEGGSHQKRLWNELFSNIIKHSFSAKNSNSLKMRIDSEYGKKMVDIYEKANFTEGDSLTLMHIKQAKSYLTSNIDYE